jgi:hypothetical protein
VSLLVLTIFVTARLPCELFIGRAVPSCSDLSLQEGFSLVRLTHILGPILGTPVPTEGFGGGACLSSSRVVSLQSDAAASGFEGVRTGFGG